MKKLLCLILALLVASCAFGCSSSKKQADTKSEPAKEVQSDIFFDSRWKNLYTDLLLGAKDKVVFYYVGLHDLNFDGTPELVVSNDGASAAYYVSVFQVIDDKAECVVGYDFMNGETADQNSDALELYSVFEDGWLTLRKNANTGEVKYFMESGNGASNIRFGGVYSFSADSVNCEPYAEFEYAETWDESYSNMKGEYRIGGTVVPIDEYEASLEEYHTVWENTEYKSYVIAGEYIANSGTFAVKVSAETIRTLFNMYKSEKSYLQ